MAKRTGIQADLRRFIKANSVSNYSISKGTGVSESILSRFMHGSDLRGDNLDAICQHLGLELTQKKGAK